MKAARGMRPRLPLCMHNQASAMNLSIKRAVASGSRQRVRIALRGRRNGLSTFRGRRLCGTEEEGDNNTIPRGSIVLPGSFNPLHFGHLHLGWSAFSFLQEKSMAPAMLVFEISVLNADKGYISEDVLNTRVDQFLEGDLKEFPGTTASNFLATSAESIYAVALTEAPLFTEKAALFPGCMFIIGVDTFVRIINAKYYDGEDHLRESLREIENLDCSFLVACRADAGEAEVKVLEDYAKDIPPGFDKLFLSLPPQVFRADISSTEIRARI